MSGELSPEAILAGLPRIRDARLAADQPFAHSLVIPAATYSPWLEDKSFLAAYDAIRGATLVDHYRAFELWSLVAETAPLGGDVLEVGVWRGGTGCLMAARLAELGLAARIALCDTFAGVVKAGPHDTAYRGGEHADASAAQVQALAERMAVVDRIDVRTGVFPKDTGPGLAERRFGLVHLDVDVYQSARDALDWAWPRLLPGGVVVFDDYGFMTCAGVTRLVNERLRWPGALAIHNLNGHALIVRLR